MPGTVPSLDDLPLVLGGPGREPVPETVDPVEQGSFAEFLGRDHDQRDEVNGAAVGVGHPGGGADGGEREHHGRTLLECRRYSTNSCAGWACRGILVLLSPVSEVRWIPIRQRRSAPGDAALEMFLMARCRGQQ